MTLDLAPFAAGAPIKHISEAAQAAQAAGGGALPSAAEPLEPLQLYAVVEHLGSLASSGHYLCYVRLGEQWFKMSDVRAKVVKVVKGVVVVVVVLVAAPAAAAAAAAITTAAAAAAAWPKGRRA